MAIPSDPRGIETRRESYKAKAGLLKNQMVDQAGDWRKGMIEAIQNSQDGYKERYGIDKLRDKSNTSESKDLLDGLEIEFSIPQPNVLLIKDNGVGLDSTQLDRWKYFGPSWKASEETLAGEKGLGRGQTIAMLYNHNIEKLEGDVEVYTNDLWIKSYLDCSQESPEFEHRQLSEEDKAELDRLGISYTCSSSFEDCRPRVNGFVWKLRKEEGSWDKEELEAYLKDAVFFRSPFDVRINGESVWSDIERNFDKKIKRDDYEIYIRKRDGEFSAYNDYRYIKDYGSNEGFSLKGLSGYVNIYPHLKQNQARNDFTSTTEQEEMFDEIRDDIFRYLVGKARSKPSSLSQTQAVGLISAMRDKGELEEYGELKFIPDIGGTPRSINEIKERRAIKGETDSPLSDRAEQMGYIVIPSAIASSWDFQQGIKRIAGEKLKDVSDTDIEPPSYERHSWEEMSDAERDFARFWKKLSETRRILQSGESDYARAWTDGTTYVVFNTNSIPVGDVKKRDWRSVFEKTFETIAHELAHIRPDINTRAHSKEHCNRTIKWMEQLVTAFNEEFPEYEIPEGFEFDLKQIDACKVQYTPEDVHEQILELKTQIKEYDTMRKRYSSIEAEQACLIEAEQYDTVKFAEKRVEGVPEQDKSVIHTLTEKVRAQKVVSGSEYCLPYFKKLDDPTLLSDLVEEKHMGTPREVAEVRPEYCRRKYGKKWRLGEDSIPRLYSREKAILERVKGAGEPVEELRRACIEPLVDASEETEERLEGKREDNKSVTVEHKYPQATIVNYPA